ncbi:hypothetical protein OSB04_004257 [Centaurea solstitialis]|uniref:Uncharacterized protein n=1 Tax=Centaurea solstitialis TaxID=347529 RepID=A0AA38U8U6_9ASTR|nr:hypothetical protein OSB04_004257 [Centaurea solstitialis]
MVENALSLRRGPHLDDDDEEEHHGDDGSKTRKHLSIPTRITNYLTRTGYLFWPILLLAIVIFTISSLFLHHRDLVCVTSVSSFDQISRSRFFGLDGLESDFGSLGVPWLNFIISTDEIAIANTSIQQDCQLQCGRSKHGKTVEWTSKDLLQGLEEFVPIYETRPIKNNMYGMGFDHSFGLWFIARWLKPEFNDREWSFQGAFDLGFKASNAGHPDLMKKHGITDLSRVLIFFDDHQNELKRLKQALKAGFSHLVFEDNYDTGTGDHYSLRQICDQFYIQGGGHSCFKDSDEARQRSRRKKFWEKAVDVRELCGPGEAWFVESILDVYWELPPVAGPSLTHQTRYDPARAPSPIVEDGRFWVVPETWIIETRELRI